MTGGGGFIGSHLCDRLLLSGHQVTALDNFATGNEMNLGSQSGNSNFRVVNETVLNLEILHSLMENSEYVFHMAAAVGVFNIVNRPLESLLANIRGTENVLEVAHSFNIPVFLASSSEVYGKNSSDSLRESDDRILGSPTILRWSYSEAKAIDESLAYAYFVERKLETRIVRFFNTVGPRQLGTYGMVVPRFIEAALKNEVINIYGDGKQTRCFVHVYDVVDAILLTAFSKNTIGKVINIGNDYEISMNDLAKKIIEETGSSSKIRHMPYQEAYGHGYEDMERRVPNIDVINQLVGWKPKRDLSIIISDIAAEMERVSRVL